MSDDIDTNTSGLIIETPATREQCAATGGRLALTERQRRFVMKAISRRVDYLRGDMRFYIKDATVEIEALEEVLAWLL